MKNNRITIENGKFVADGKEIWINGVNTPWNNWNDFGGNYDNDWWNDHYKALSENGVNASRVWINCNNNQNAVQIDDKGIVSGVSEKHWADLEAFFAIAEKYGIYIMATPLSFDHFKDNKNDKYPQATKWRAMVQSEEGIDSYIHHYIIPFLNQFSSNSYLWCIDLMNEPDWVHENEECGQLEWKDISNFFARAAAAIHENSSVLVTVGMSFPKYNADGPNCEGNKVSDEFLQNLYPNKNARLDFWSPHYYDWVAEHYGVPYISKPSGSRNEGGWGLCPSKPSVLAECPANGSANSTLFDDYANAYKNGWLGIMPWTSNGVDGNGGFDEVTAVSNRVFEFQL